MEPPDEAVPAAVLELGRQRDGRLPEDADLLGDALAKARHLAEVLPPEAPVQGAPEEERARLRTILQEAGQSRGLGLVQVRSDVA